VLATLGGAPVEHRTDSLSAAFRNRAADAAEVVAEHNARRRIALHCIACRRVPACLLGSVRPMRRRACVHALLALAAIGPAAAEAPSDLRGVWSPDPACAETSLRHIIGMHTLEWRDGGRRLVFAEVSFLIQADRIGIQVTRAENGDSPLRAGDVVQYRRVPGGIRPLAIERGGSEISIRAPRTFFACRR
jgi:hypothetical protein